MGAESIMAGNFLFSFWIGGGFLFLLFLKRRDR